MTALCLDLGENEADFQHAVIELARTLGFRVAHFRAAKTSKGWRTPVEADGKGFPDLLLVGRGRIIAVELKSAKGKVTLEQQGWLNDFAVNGAEAYLWRPADLDEIVGVLSGQGVPGKREALDGWAIATGRAPDWEAAKHSEQPSDEEQGGGDG